MNTIDDLLDAIATSKASAQAFIADPPTFVGRSHRKAEQQ
jgi:hypothetical protein